MTTGGEGGMLTTNEDSVWERARSFRDHGAKHSTDGNGKNSHPFQWIHDSFGTNWRLTEMQSAIGRAQLLKVRQWAALRRRNAAILTDRLADCSALRVTVPPPEIGHSYYKYYVFVRRDYLRASTNRNQIMASIRAEGVPCFSGICGEIYLEKAFPKELRPLEPKKVARELGETSLMFLVHPTLAEQDMMDTCYAIEKVMALAMK